MERETQREMVSGDSHRMKGEVGEGDRGGGGSVDHLLYSLLALSSPCKASP